jgi:hypothetical protein
MAHKNKPDPKTINKLHEHYDVNPQPEFLPSLKNRLMDRFSTQVRTKTKHNPRRFALRVAIVLIIGAIAFLFTPQGRSFAQEYIPQFFKRAESNLRPHGFDVVATITVRAEIHATEAKFATDHPEIPTATPTITPTPEPGSYMAATQTVQEIEETLGFDVLEPGWLPELVYYSSGASADFEMGIAYQFYGSGSNGLTIKQYPADLALDLPVIGATQNVDIVNINGNTGEYIKGVWEGTDKGWVWSPNPYLQRLRWEQDGMIFEFMFFGHISRMSKIDLIAIAESMH